jgi:peptide/nickel transport system ATP-binding protein
MDPAQRINEPPITGDPPNPIDPPSGCRFHTRCPFAEEVCKTTDPVLGSWQGAQSHAAACHLHNPSSGHSRAGTA